MQRVWGFDIQKEMPLAEAISTLNEYLSKTSRRTGKKLSFIGLHKKRSIITFRYEEKGYR